MTDTPVQWTSVLCAPFPVALVSQEEEEFRLLAMSKEAGDLLGCPIEQFQRIEGGKWMSYLHPDDMKRLLPFMKDLKKKSRLSFAVRCRKTGKRSYEWISGYLKHDASDKEGKRYFLFFYTKDDIEFLDHQSWSHASNERLIIQDVIDAVDVPIYWKDNRRRYLGANQAYLDYFGIASEDDLIGKTNEAIFTEGDQDLVREEEKRVLQGESIHKEAPIVVAGKVHLASITEKPMKKGGRIIGMIGSFRDITEEKNNILELRNLANRDELTNSQNRRSYFRWLRENQKKYESGGDDFAIIMMDLDNFKDINDTYGHEAGDRVLMEFAKRAKNNKTKEEHFFRLGGDEFVMMVEKSTPETIESCIKRLQDEMSRPMDVNGRDLLVGASMGLATYSEALDIDLLLREADMSMYEDKKKRKASR